MGKEFLRDTVERSVYTMAETALGIIGTCAIMEQVNWKIVVSASILSGIVTVLKCIAVRGKTDDQ